MGRDKSEQGASSKLQTRGMERSARVYRRSAEKLARFFRARKRMSDVIGAAFIFFFSIPLQPQLGNFFDSSIDRSIDRSAPRDRLSNRDRSAAPFPLCRLFAGKKESAGRKQSQQVLGVARMDTYIRVRMAGCSSRKCDLATTHRSRSSRTRDVFFPGYERCSTVFDGMSRIRGGGGGWLSATFGDFDEFRLGNR